MSYLVDYFMFSVKDNAKQIASEIDYVVYYGGGHIHACDITFIDKVLPDYDSAVEYIESLNKKVTELVAVKYICVNLSKDEYSKKLKDLELKYYETLSKYNKLESTVYALGLKSDVVICRHCGTKIKKEYIESNYCPLCKQDMRNKTLLTQKERLKNKLNQLDLAIKEERKRLNEKSKNKEEKWVVRVGHREF